MLLASNNHLPKPYTGIGSEPGVDPHGQDAAEQQTRCVIENEEFLRFLRDAAPDDDLPASTLRWINVGGISWDVMSALALRYDIHPLALEDILHEQGHNHSKADYYAEHIFIRVLCHSIPTEEDIERGVEAKTEFPGYAGYPRHNVSPPVPNRRKLRARFSGLSGFYLSSRQQQILRLAALTKGERIIVSHAPMFIFLCRNGTVISLHPKPSLDFTEPITERMQQAHSLLRTSSDPSMVVEALLDLVVDRILEVMDNYQDSIRELEQKVLVKPSMSTVRSLHILSGDLITHRRTLEPIRSTIHGLRKYDRERCIALKIDVDDRGGRTWGQNGYMSDMSKIYLADVLDHMDFVLTSLEMLASTSENLINYAFNMASYEANEIMRRLTLATIIFLPLTLLTGYFGMNFTEMWSVNNNSDLLFWKIALPCMGLIVPMFLASDIKKAFHYTQKVVSVRRAVRAENTNSRQSHVWAKEPA
ncbi:CorA-like protein [Mycena kentingensis (nom. inval.)]|nr:CorA-like protein [Mycena kentingensis (nom. inval.)]